MEELVFALLLGDDDSCDVSSATLEGSAWTEQSIYVTNIHQTMCTVTCKILE